MCPNLKLSKVKLYSGFLQQTSVSHIHHENTELNLDYITENAVAIVEISALEKINVDKVLQWLVDHSL